MYKLIDYFKALLIIPMTLILSGVSMTSEKVDNSVSELFKYSLIGSITNGDNTQFVFVIESLSFLIFFVILYGNIIHRNFCMAANYRFSRISNRVRWYFRECIHLFGVTFVYSFFYLIIKLIIAINISLYECNGDAIEYFVLFFCWMCCLNVIFTLVVNMVALIKGTNFSMIAFSISVVILVSLAIVTSSYRIPSFANPLSINLEWLAWVKVLYLVGIAAVVGIVYGLYIRKYDIGVKGEM